MELLEKKETPQEEYSRLLEEIKKDVTKAKLITLINERALLPLNKLWMRFGQLIGIIISPIILGIIFFGIFTPYSLLMRLFGRDELQLKFGKRESYWKLRNQSIPLTNFRKQF